MKQYEVGTIIQRRDGYCFIKTREGALMAQHRWVATMRLGRPLKPGEVVIRVKPDRLDNSWKNLVVVQHSLTKFQYLPTTRIIYVPRKTKGAAHVTPERPVS